MNVVTVIKGNKQRNKRESLICDDEQRTWFEIARVKETIGDARRCGDE